jgi:hypothetical protein
MENSEQKNRRSTENQRITLVNLGRRKLVNVGSRLTEYDAYARKSAHAMLAKHDAWLKRREINGPLGPKDRVGYVGIGIFGFKARS